MPAPSATGVYSFNGNKIITTGAGGMVVSNHPDWAEHAKHLSTQAKADELQFLHDEVGYNYRMTNLQAAPYGSAAGGASPWRGTGKAGQCSWAFCARRAPLCWRRWVLSGGLEAAGS